MSRRVIASRRLVGGSRRILRRSLAAVSTDTASDWRTAHPAAAGAGINGVRRDRTVGRTARSGAASRDPQPAGHLDKVRPHRRTAEGVSATADLLYGY